MILQHLIWWALTIACVVWYCTITIYVAIKGFIDIRTMLGDLDERNANARATARNDFTPPPSKDKTA